jgi:hypothetical protein
MINPEVLVDLFNYSLHKNLDQFHKLVSLTQEGYLMMGRFSRYPQQTEINSGMLNLQESFLPLEINKT